MSTSGPSAVTAMVAALARVLDLDLMALAKDLMPDEQTPLAG